MTISAKDLLLKLTREAYGDNDEMSPKAVLWRVTDEKADWRPDGGPPATISQFIWHVARAKMPYCLEEGEDRATERSPIGKLAPADSRPRHPVSHDYGTGARRHP